MTTGTVASMAENPFPCTSQGECSGLTGSTCDTSKGFCICPVENPILDDEFDVCVSEKKLNEACEYTSQCEEGEEYSVCGKDLKCVCRDGFILEEYPNVGFQCVSRNPSQGPGAVDPAMIGVLVGLALMFVIICVVLRLFSKARFRENRSIFNTPNPRLMNASLFKDSKLLSPSRGERRGSRVSVRGPSRAQSVTSVNAATAARSPNGSLAKGGVAGRRGSAMSAVSATGSVAHSGGVAPKTPSPAKHPKTKKETTVAIENVD